jgi:hypothetical protein
MDQQLSVWLELDLARDRIAGRLHDGDRAPEVFSGWLELVAAVEGARSRQGNAPEVGREGPPAPEPR